MRLCEIAKVYLKSTNNIFLEKYQGKSIWIVWVNFINFIQLRSQDAVDKSAEAFKLECLEIE